jgi:hypothetical protein
MSRKCHFKNKLPTNPHGVTVQKTNLDISTAVRTSSLTYMYALQFQSVAPSPWANFLTVGLKILTAILGGGTGGGDGIDKVDNGSPMQVSYKKKLAEYLWSLR